jgi:hypothetical protein
MLTCHSVLSEAASASSTTEDSSVSVTDHRRYRSAGEVSFAASYAEGLAAEGVWLSVALHRTLHRPLGMFDQRSLFWHSGRSAMDDIVQAGSFGRAELAAGWRDVALDWTVEVLTVFPVARGQPGHAGGAPDTADRAPLVTCDTA